MQISVEFADYLADAIESKYSMDTVLTMFSLAYVNRNIHDYIHVSVAFICVRQNKGHVTGPAAHSRYMPRYVGYVSHGASCDTPLQGWHQSIVARSPRPQSKSCSMRKFGVVEPARDIPCAIPVTYLYLCVDLGYPLQARVVTGL